MNILFAILLFLLLISEIVFGIFILKRMNSLDDNIQPVEINGGLEKINKFIRREFLFEFIKWIMKAPTTIDMDGPVKLPSFIRDLKNPEILQEKMSIITTQIISKMSIYLICEFDKIYKKSEDLELLYTYVTRQVMFYIRRVDFEITSMLETDKESKPTDLLKQYVLSIEAEIYKLNDIKIVETNTQEIEEDDK